MISSNVHLCVIPESYWDTSTSATLSKFRIAGFAGEALMAERRIRKKVNLENERRRYSLLCQRMETEVLKSGLLEIVTDIEMTASVLSLNKIPSIVLDHTYLDILRAVINDESPGRFGATFFPPGEVKSHLEVFEGICAEQGVSDAPSLQIRSKLYRWADQAKCGIIELQNHFAFVESLDSNSLSLIEDLRKRQREHQSLMNLRLTSAVDLSKEDLHEVDAFKSDYKQRQVQTLSAAVLKAIKHKEPANFSNRSNDVITEVLHRFTYVLPDQSTTPFNLRVVYADGSEGRPFLIRCLTAKDQGEVTVTEKSPPLRAVLMSMRHVDLDRNVDMAWFRNREVSKMRTLAETDEYCYKTTLELLRKALMEGPLRLHMYHIGFEPAVIGFYRAVVEMLLANQSVSILPHYYRGKEGFELGNLWR